ncbi:hypothetical protein LMG22931_07114 [Paraburkholderia nemoris]|nr:hypothetical protein LMG22931_07114 [Paraburkholderia nemoris]
MSSGATVRDPQQRTLFRDKRGECRRLCGRPLVRVALSGQIGQQAIAQPLERCCPLLRPGDLFRQTFAFGL